MHTCTPIRTSCRRLADFGGPSGTETGAFVSFRRAAVSQLSFGWSIQREFSGALVLNSGSFGFCGVLNLYLVVGKAHHQSIRRYSVSSRILQVVRATESRLYGDLALGLVLRVLSTYTGLLWSTTPPDTFPTNPSPWYHWLVGFFFFFLWFCSRHTEAA